MTRRLIGIGNPDRADDAAGWEVAGRVSAWHTEQLRVGSIDVIDTWTSEDDVVIVDAMRTGAPPGTVREFDTTSAPLPAGSFASTHSFGPSEIVELARSMGRMPRSLRVIGIELERVELGAPMSTDVRAAVDRVVRRFQDE